MAKRVKSTKIGDVFEVKISETEKRYIQYVVSDMTQLNCDVIRAFQKKYSIDSNPSVDEIVNDEVDFYAHCATKLGIKMGCWTLYGNSQNVGEFNSVLFRCTSDHGGGISEKWYVWHVNEETKHVGKLEGENRKAELGLAFSPLSIVNRLREGKFVGVYPTFE